MALGQQPLLDPELFLPLANLVAQYGIKNLVETGTGPSSSGMEAAKRLGLKGYTCDVFLPCSQRAIEMYPTFDVYHGNSIDFLQSILPDLEGGTFFWLDGHCPTDKSCEPGGIFPLFEEMELVRDLKRGFDRDVLWLDDIAMITDPANPTASSWDVDLAGTRWTGESGHTWAEYLGVFSATHDFEVVDCMLRLTPKP